MMGAKLEMKIDEMSDEIIENAHKLLEELWGKNSIKKMDISQLRNLQDICESTRSFAAVENFIRYQMGRKETSKVWMEFGEKLIQDLRELKEKAHSIIKSLGESECEEKEVWMKLVRRYVGYLIRYFVYLKKKGGEK
ncbi:MAG: hypothetical protein QXT26_06640 [Thermoproteota archaeon]